MKLKRWISDFFQSVKTFVRRIWNRRHVIGDVVKHKHRFIVLDTETYKEKFSFHLSGINLFVFFGATALVLILLTSLLLAFTPLRELIPGYTNTKLVKQTYRNAQIIDSLAYQIEAQEYMLADIQDILLGKDPGERNDKRNTVKDSSKTTATEYVHTLADTMLRNEIEGRGGDVSFVFPIEGKIVRKYNANSGFYGVDIGCKSVADVKSVQDGVVLWSYKDDAGNVTIIVAHEYDVLSQYRFEGKAVKETGDVVMAGETIGKLSARNSKGEPVLHFEMRKEGEPVNPANYIENKR